MTSQINRILQHGAGPSLCDFLGLQGVTVERDCSRLVLTPTVGPGRDDLAAPGVEAVVLESRHERPTFCCLGVG